MRLPGSLRARIALAAVAAVGVCGILAGGLLLATVERDGRNQIDAELRERADSILAGPATPTAAVRAAATRCCAAAARSRRSPTATRSPTRRATRPT